MVFDLKDNFAYSVWIWNSLSSSLFCLLFCLLCCFVFNPVFQMKHCKINFNLRLMENIFYSSEYRVHTDEVTILHCFELLKGIEIKWEDILWFYCNCNSRWSYHNQNKANMMEFLDRQYWKHISSLILCQGTKIRFQINGIIKQYNVAYES